MADFEVVTISGVDTTDAGRLYRPDEQYLIVESIFGRNGYSPDGTLFLPGGETLYLGHRSEGGRGYSIGRQESGYRNPALYVPRTGSGMDMPLLEVDGNLEDLDVRFSGFLPLVANRLLGLGKHAMKEAIYGVEIPFRGSPSAEHRKKRDELGRLLIDNALLDDGKRDISEEELDDFYAAMDDFLGEELAEVEGLESDKHAFNWLERPYEEFCVGIQRRICGTIVR